MMVLLLIVVLSFVPSIYAEEANSFLAPRAVGKSTLDGTDSNNDVDMCVKKYFNSFSAAPAIPFCIKAAEQGSAQGQTILGTFYVYQYSGKEKGLEGVSWLQKAAFQGHADAEFTLGVLYGLGRSVDKNHIIARQWYKKAAEKGHVEAAFNLGLSYFLSTDAPRDPVKAIKWFKVAAKKGYTFAQFNLGLIYFDGKIVQQDYPEALQWFQMAAEQGYKKAQHNVGMAYLRGYGVQQDYSEAAKWYRKASDQRYAFAQYALGVLYQYGLGVKRDIEAARKWYSMPASRGYGNSINALKSLSQSHQAEAAPLSKTALDKIDRAPFYILELITQLPRPVIKYENDCEALTDKRYVLSRGAEHTRQLNKCEKYMTKSNAPRDMFLFATHKFDNRATGLFSKKRTPEQTENMKKRILWERKSAEMGYFDSQYDLGTICLIFKGKKICRGGEAEKWLKLAAKQSRPDIYCLAKGVYPDDRLKQLEWFTLAAKAGENCGMEKLALYYVGKGGAYLPVAEAWYNQSIESTKQAEEIESFNQVMLQMLTEKFKSDFKLAIGDGELAAPQKILSAKYLDEIRNGEVNKFGLPTSFNKGVSKQ